MIAAIFLVAGFILVVNALTDGAFIRLLLFRKEKE